MIIKDVERQIAEGVVNALLSARFSISVYDGEEWAIEKSRNVEQIMDSMFSTDSDVLRVYHGGKRAGFVAFIWGNDIDVIYDYSEALGSALQPVFRARSEYEKSLQS